jgi:hypothetical protein
MKGSDPPLVRATSQIFSASRFRPVIAAGCVVVSAAACRGAVAEGEVHLDRLPALSAVPEARIGDFDDPVRGFSSVGGLDVGPDGNLYVLERSVLEIRVLTPDGELLRRIGGRGGGPGEFEAPPRFGVVGDTVWAIDPHSSRITLFDTRGRVLSTGTPQGVAVPLPDAYGDVLPWTMREDGRFTSRLTRVRSGEATGVKETDRIPVPLVLFDATGAVSDTIGWAGGPPPSAWRPSSEDDIGWGEVSVGNRRLLVPSPPTRLPWWVSLLDGYIVVDAPAPPSGHEATITVTRFGLSENTVYATAVHYRPDPYSADLLDSIASRAARGEQGGMIPFVIRDGARPRAPEDWPQIAQALRSAMRFPPFQRPIDHVWVAQDESVWLRRWDGISPSARWVILDAGGGPRGGLELPANVDPLWHRNGVLWATVPDELDVPWVVRYAIH